MAANPDDLMVEELQQSPCLFEYVRAAYEEWYGHDPSDDGLDFSPLVPLGQVQELIETRES